MIPRFTGQRAQRRRGPTGGTLLPTPGGQIIVDVIERLPVVLDGEHGHLPRPALANLLLGKASAYTEVDDDPRRTRHLDDMGTLAALVDGTDLAVISAAGARHLARFRLCLEIMASGAGPWQVSDASRLGLDRLRLAAGDGR